MGVADSLLLKVQDQALIENENINENNNNNDDNNDLKDDNTAVAPLSALMAGAVKLMVQAFRVLPKGIAKTLIQKQAFLSIGRRTDIPPTIVPSATTTLNHHHATPTTTTTTITSSTTSSSTATTNTLTRLSRALASAASISIGILKSGVLGVAVFGVYDILIFQRTSFFSSKQQQQHDEQGDTHEDNNAVSLLVPTMKRASLSSSSSNQNIDIITSNGDDDLTLIWVQTSVSPPSTLPLMTHFGVGALSGLAQSLAMDVWEIMTYFWNHRHRPITSTAKTTTSSTTTAIKSFLKRNYTIWRHLNYPFMMRRCIHHMIGFATLFGCYETIRRIMNQSIHQYLSSGSSSVPYTVSYLEQYRLIHRLHNIKYQTTTNHEKSTTKTSEEPSACYDMTILPFMTAFLAGGFAGLIHCFVNHYTRQWKLQQSFFYQIMIPKPINIPTKVTTGTTEKINTISTNINNYTNNRCSNNNKAKPLGTPTAQASCLHPKEQQQHHRRRQRGRFPKGPSLSRLGGSFLPTAFCFLAFQYGGDVTKQLFLVDHDNDNKDDE